MGAVELNEADAQSVMSSLRPFWHPVAAVADLARGPVATTLLGEELAVVRLGSRVVAFRDLCIHRGTRLSLGWVNDRGCVVCPYHGWEYDAQGRCQRIPSRPTTRVPPSAKVDAYRTTTAYGLVWVALEEPRCALPDFPEWDDDEFCVDFAEPSLWGASAGRVIENNIDISHFAFVHPGLLADPEDCEVDDFDHLEVDGMQILLRDHRRDAVGGEFGVASETVVRDSWITVPFTWRIRLNSDKGISFVFIAVQPVSDRQSVAHVRVGRQRAMEPIGAEFSRNLIEQDIHIVESQRPELLPLDVTRELHIRNVDTASLEYRKLLGKVTGGHYS